MAVIFFILTCKRSICPHLHNVKALNLNQQSYNVFSIRFLEPEETDIKFKAEDIYNNRFLPDEDDSDVDEDDESSPFERMMKKMEDISPDKNGMVFKKVLQQGSGAIVPEGAIVRSMSNNYRND